MSSITRRAGVSLAAAATLLLSTVGTAVAQPTTTDEPAAAAAGWLTTQLTIDDDGAYYYVDGDWPHVDLGLTLDILFGLAGAQVGGDRIADIARYLDREATVTEYTGIDWGDIYAGQTAKVIIGADVVGLDAENLGGMDLIQQLEDLQSDDEGHEGWYRNQDVDNDFSSTLSQSLAVVALHRVDATTTLDAGIEFLLDQQCDDGGFRSNPAAETCSGEVDSTAIAADALFAVGETDAAQDAVAWLADQQTEEGGFQGSDDLSTNSTGLAAVAFASAGPDYHGELQLAQEWIVGLQNGCDSAEPGSIDAGPADEGDLARSTPQALAGLASASLGTISAAGAAAAPSLLDCPEPAPRDVAVTCDVGDTVLPGERVGCEISGLDAEETVHVTVTLNPTLLDEDIAADVSGTAAFAFDVPDDAREGDTITIRIDGEGDAFSTELSITIGAEAEAEPEPEPVDEPSDGEERPDDEPLEGTEADEGELPRTGGSAVQFGALAALLLLAGIAFVGYGRTRDERS